MNQNEFEQRLKEKLANRPFPPGEGGWERLQAALAGEPPAVAEKPRKGILILMPSWSKIAASVALLVSAGVGAYYFMSHGGRTTDAPASTAKVAPVQAPLPSSVSSQSTTIDPNATSSSTAIAAPAFTGNHSSASSLGTAKQTRKQIPEVAGPELQPQEQLPVVPERAPEPGPVAQSNQPQDPRPVQVTRPFGDRDPLPEDNYGQTRDRVPVNIGVAAQVGRVSVGKMNYQLGIIAHQRISDRVFAEATLALASSDVSYSRNNSFSGVKTGDQLTSGLNFNQNINARYRSNILSMGISPSVGYKVTKGISLSVGGALYRNFNQSLSLDQGSVDEAAVSNNVISTSKSISEWDAGITGGAECKVTSKISLNAQYRYGLSTYMIVEHTEVRNSVLNFGFKWLFGKR